MANNHRRFAGFSIARREMLRGAVTSGLITSGLLPGSRQAAEAAPADPDHGAVVTPDPIPGAITASGVRVELAFFAAPPRSAHAKPYTLLNTLTPGGDGTAFVYTNDTRGKIWRISTATGQASLFLDHALAVNGALVTGSREQGLRSFAFHPDFTRTGSPGFNKLYTMSTETVASQPAGVRLFGDRFSTHKSHNVVAEWSVFADDRTRVDPSSRRELLRIAHWESNHNSDQLIFNPRAKRGTAAYGKLFFGTGDGGGGGDPQSQAQDKQLLLGKICRIDPTGTNKGRYGVPADNPFVGNPDYLDEIWAIGVRHPQNISFDYDGRRFIFSDIGQNEVEEVNVLVKGANYGWADREGTFVTDRSDLRTLYALGANDADKGFTYPVAQYDHNEGSAITGGFVYRGSRIPYLRGHYLCGDILRGRVFHVPAADLRLGSQATLRELTLLHNGVETTLLDLTQGVGRVDLRFGQDKDGELYVMSKQDGVIRKLGPAA